jgi:prepilin-type N-terminal cleavage/methylation domain-containing protein
MHHPAYQKSRQRFAAGVFLTMLNIGTQKGFTLIELVTTLILVGIIGAFASFFLYTGVSGFLKSKDISETSLKAQIALDRISAELRSIDSLVNNPVQDSNIQYKSKSIDFPGTRKISYANEQIFITVDGTANVLLNNVLGFKLRWTSKDLNHASGGNNEIAAIDIEFTTREIASPFLEKIYPRAMLAAPP